MEHKEKKLTDNSEEKWISWDKMWIDETDDIRLSYDKEHQDRLFLSYMEYGELLPIVLSNRKSPYSTHKKYKVIGGKYRFSIHKRLEKIGINRAKCKIFYGLTELEELYLQQDLKEVARRHSPIETLRFISILEEKINDQSHDETQFYKLVMKKLKVSRATAFRRIRFARAYKNHILEDVTWKKYNKGEATTEFIIGLLNLHERKKKKLLETQEEEKTGENTSDLQESTIEVAVSESLTEKYIPDIKSKEEPLSDGALQHLSDLPKDTSEKTLPDINEDHTEQDKSEIESISSVPEKVSEILPKIITCKECTAFNFRSKCPGLINFSQCPKCKSMYFYKSVSGQIVQYDPDSGLCADSPDRIEYIVEKAMDEDPSLYEGYKHKKDTLSIFIERVLEDTNGGADMDNAAKVIQAYFKRKYDIG